MVSTDHTAVLQLRRCILRQLYAWFQQVPLAPVELQRIAQACNSSDQDLNWNILYLEKKGWVELSHDVNCPPYVSCTAELTGAGIDLVEDPDAFERQFPVGKTAGGNSGEEMKDER